MSYYTDRLVAISTLMFPLGSNPSSWLINSNMVLCTSLSPPAPSSNRAPPMASTSSKKMMHAFFPLAISNSSRTIRAPSPTYFCTSSDPITRMKVASVRLATARAQSVLPVPGGPKSRTPFGGSMPSLTNLSGYVKVKSWMWSTNNLTYGYQRCLHNFTKFLNLLFAASDIGVGYVWFLFNLHHCN